MVKLLATQSVRHSALISKVARCSTDKMNKRKEDHELFESVWSLWLKGHRTPFEFITFSFMIDNVSRALTHQLVRHRLASFVQQSQRYVKYSKDSEIWEGHIIPDLSYLSEENFSKALKVYEGSVTLSKNNYDNLLQLGVKAEDARAILINACPSVICMHFNLRHFLEVIFPLRSDKHAQKEIRTLIHALMLNIVDYYVKNDASVMAEFLYFYKKLLNKCCANCDHFLNLTLLKDNEKKSNCLKHKLDINDETKLKFYCSDFTVRLNKCQMLSDSM